MTDDTPRSPFTQFIENELFTSHADAPTCQTVHPLLAAALDSLCEGDLDSLTELEKQIAICLSSEVVEMHKSEPDAWPAVPTESTVVMTQQELRDLLTDTIGLTFFLGPVLKKLYRLQHGDEDASDAG